MKKSEVDFALTCPGGLQAEFMCRHEGLLQWRGFLPPLSGELGADCIEYLFYTDESGREVQAPVKAFEGYADPVSAAAVLGRKGGSVKSPRKALSSRENGKKGGRPRKAEN